MKRRYAVRCLLFISFAVVAGSIASCKKDSATKATGSSTNTSDNIQNGAPAKIGLYETDSSIYKLLYLDVSKVGTQETDDWMVFDTGSGGMVMDAKDVLPGSMITNSGFNFTGDSIVYNGITITKYTASVEYGDDAASDAKVYGNLAYANVTMDKEGGNVVIQRLPFFLYYKAVDANGKAEPKDEFNVFGVNEEYDVPTFANGVNITSPFTYYTPGTGLTKGFKIAKLGTGNFSLDGTYVNGVVTLGLTADDLSSSSGFTFTQLKADEYGYEPVVSGSITYNSKTISAYLLFDSGTEPYNYIEDNNAKRNVTDSLANNAQVTVNTSSGFAYNFTVVSQVTNNIYSKGDCLTYIENPKDSGVDVSIFSLEYFLNNEYMLDFGSHRLGLKNN